MLKTIIIFVLILLTAVNLALLWQILRKMKKNLDKKLETVEPYIMVRLTAFGVNMVIIAVIGLARVLLQIFH